MPRTTYTIMSRMVIQSRDCRCWALVPLLALHDHHDYGDREISFYNIKPCASRAILDILSIKFIQACTTGVFLHVLAIPLQNSLSVMVPLQVLAVPFVLSGSISICLYVFAVKLRNSDTTRIFL